jgi:predicted N-acyltransferase
MNLLDQEYQILRAMNRIGNATWNAITTEARLPSMTQEFFVSHKLIQTSGCVKGSSAPCYALTKAGKELIEAVK